MKCSVPRRIAAIGGIAAVFAVIVTGAPAVPIHGVDANTRDSASGTPDARPHQTLYQSATPLSKPQTETIGRSRSEASRRGVRR